jgi:hypothetical protein
MRDAEQKGEKKKKNSRTEENTAAMAGEEN